jgi:hypothetical protein
MKKSRSDNEAPRAIEKWGWKYHHLGIPTNRVMAGEKYLARFDIAVSGFQTSPFGIEWMRYGERSTIHKLIQTIPHLAFEVDDLDRELKAHKFEILTSPNSPSDGVRVVMIEHNGAPVELIEFKKTERRPVLKLTLSVIPDKLAICSLDIDSPVPSWASEEGFFSITRTDDELTVVCPELRVPAEIKSEKNWRAIKIRGPLDFSLTGILASIATPLAENGISIFAISTFQTDYVLLKEENLERALNILDTCFNVDN